MRVTFRYQNPTPLHCDVAIFVNGAFTGTITLRQDEVVGFTQIVSYGCLKGIDTFTGQGASELSKDERAGSLPARPPTSHP